MKTEFLLLQLPRSLGRGGRRGRLPHKDLLYFAHPLVEERMGRVLDPDEKSNGNTEEVGQLQWQRYGKEGKGGVTALDKRSRDTRARLTSAQLLCGTEQTWSMKLRLKYEIAAFIGNRWSNICNFIWCPLHVECLHTLNTAQ